MLTHTLLGFGCVSSDQLGLAATADAHLCGSGVPRAHILAVVMPWNGRALGKNLPSKVYSGSLLGKLDKLCKAVCLG